MRLVSIRGLLFLLLFGLLSLARAGESLAPLPDPLSLKDALRLAGLEIPGILRADAGLRTAEANSGAADALDDTRVQLEARARVIEPSHKSDNPDHNDSSAILTLRKRLYDFGHGTALRSAAEKERQAADLERVEARQQSVLRIMRAFFDVLLADLEYARDNEAMSVAYIALDKARDRSELGRLSDVDLLELETEYEQWRVKQLVSGQKQRLSRSVLAIAMGRPQDLVSKLVMPDIPVSPVPAGEFDEFWMRVQQQSPRLRALGMRLQAASEYLASARASEGPVLSAELEAGVYNRTTKSTHPVGGGLLLELPLYSGSRRDAAVSQAQAGLGRARASLLEASQELRQGALQSFLDRTRLESHLRAVGVEADYRDLYLDRSRALYDLEVKTDLGDAMTRISEVRAAQARLLFDWAINEARIKAMTGTLLEEQK